MCWRTGRDDRNGLCTLFIFLIVAVYYRCALCFCYSFAPWLVQRLSTAPGPPRIKARMFLLKLSHLSSYLPYITSYSEMGIFGSSSENKLLLQELAKYDTVIILDDSGSMGGENWKQVSLL